MDRRSFLRLMAGAGAAPAVWRKYPNRWVSPVTEKAQARPGRWTIFATTCRECPAGCGMHVRCREGRVVKPEGNPDHPVNHGGLCPRGQSAPQGLYDPDRVRQPLRAGAQSREGPTRPRSGVATDRDASAARPSGPASVPRGSGFEPIPWPRAFQDIAQVLRSAKRLFIISGLQTGSLAEILQQFHRAAGLPGQVAFYEAFAYDALRAANGRLFGRPVIPRLRLQDCDLILSLGAEFLETWISNVEFARQFAQMHHRPPDYQGEMIYIAPRLSLTAANADYFLQTPAGQEYDVAMAILREVRGRQGPQGEDGPAVRSSSSGEGIHREAIGRLADKLIQAKKAVVLGGPTAATGPAAERLATAAMMLNQALGATGGAVDFSQTHALGQTMPGAQVQEMVQGLGPDDVLLVHQTNPAYSLPRLQESLGRAGSLIYLGTMMNETARLAQWVLPVHSPLEAWGDYEPWTGIRCLMQPTMGQLHDTMHSGDVLLALAKSLGRPLQREGQTPATFYDWLRSHWRQTPGQISDAEFELFWRQALQRGGFFEEASREQQPSPMGPMSPLGPVSEQNQATEAAARSPEEMHLWLWPSVLLFDGRLANRGWMQEVPERMSTLAWGSWVDISPATARRLRVAQGEVLEVANSAGRVNVPARITDEVADNIAALALGQGHTALGEVAAGRGVNAFHLRTPGDSNSLFGTVTLRKTGGEGTLIHLSATQNQWGRSVVQWVSREGLRTPSDQDREEIIWPGPAGYDPHRDLYAPHEYPEHRWAMVIDLDRCIGCGACEVACYAENNIPVMGPERLAKGREMSWLKVPPYRHPQEALRVGFLPLPCQHCDAAPCEPVCPVFAAVHNEQGLNAQIYNRCIGTRYCSNNCPYKVRRFGWFDPEWRAPLDLQLNPDVTVRCRGVMEKCTFCIQRIHYHERMARVEGRPLREGEIQPACVQSCPTRTFVFGDLLRPDSEVNQLFHHPRRYQLLKELNTKPAVVYLKRIRPEESAPA